MAQLVRDGVSLAYDDLGGGEAPLVFVHGVACHRGFWTPQVRHFASTHRVLLFDLRGHGESDAPRQRYTIQCFADDVAWMCGQLGIMRPVVVGHSLGGLVALGFAERHPTVVRAAVLIDAVLLPDGQRAGRVQQLVNQLRGPEHERALREYFLGFFGCYDSPEQVAWVMEQIARTPSHVTSSVWEESVRDWDDAGALRRCQVPLLYLDAGTPNADLLRAVKLCETLMIGRTIGSGHFSPLAVPGQTNAVLERFLAIT